MFGLEWLIEFSHVVFGLEWLIEFSHVALCGFTLSRLSIFPDVSLNRPEGWQYQKQSEETAEGSVNLKTSRRDKTEQCRVCLSLTEFSIGLEASGEIETEE